MYQLIKIKKKNLLDVSRKSTLFCLVFVTNKNIYMLKTTWEP